MKKGFTLIELLAVLVLISSLFMVVISMISGQIKNQEKDINAAELKTFCAASKLYINKSGYNNVLKEVKLIDLEKSGFLTNLNQKYKEKTLYVGYKDNYFCCCTKKDAKKELSEDNSTCNDIEVCKRLF